MCLLRSLVEISFYIIILWIDVDRHSLPHTRLPSFELFCTHLLLQAYFGWLVGLGFNGPLRQYFSLYRAVSKREGERGKKG